MSRPAVLERSPIKYDIMRLYAEGKHPSEIAEIYSCEVSTAITFRTRHKFEIEALRGKVNDEWATLWVADKHKRLQDIQSDIEDINDALARLPDVLAEAMRSGSKASKARADAAIALIRTKHAAFHQIAEEMGDLKQTVDLRAKITYEVRGVSDDDLT